MSESFTIVDPKIGALFGAARAVMGAAGGVLGTLGVVNSGTWELVSSAALLIGTIAWSTWEKYRTVRKVNGQ